MPQIDTEPRVTAVLADIYRAVGSQDFPPIWPGDVIATAMLIVALHEVRDALNRKDS